MKKGIRMQGWEGRSGVRIEGERKDIRKEMRRERKGARQEGGVKEGSDVRRGRKQLRRRKKRKKGVAIGGKDKWKEEDTERRQGRL